MNLGAPYTRGRLNLFRPVQCKALQEIDLEGGKGCDLPLVLDVFCDCLEVRDFCHA